MNKQEVLEELETTSTQFFHVATSTGVEANNKTLSTGVFAGLGIAKSVLTKLEEPQKVKVPAYVAEWIERNKSGDVQLIIILKYFGQWYEMNENENLNDEICKWVIENSETFMRAWLDGYEVEEEPKWKIINDQKYCLTSIEAGYGNSLHWAFDSTKKKPILFDNEETALYTAYITGGTVEKV